MFRSLYSIGYNFTFIGLVFCQSIQSSLLLSSSPASSRFPRSRRFIRALRSVDYLAGREETCSQLIYQAFRVISCLITRLTFSVVFFFFFSPRSTPDGAPVWALKRWSLRAHSGVLSVTWPQQLTCVLRRTKLPGSCQKRTLAAAS